MPTEQPIKVSVVLCTFNGAAFLPDQLESIRMQTYPIHELVVVDDAVAGVCPDYWVVSAESKDEFLACLLMQGSSLVVGLQHVPVV